MARTLIVSDRHNSFFSANNIRVGNQIPTEGNYVKGDIIVNIGDNTASEAMWICVESGNPGIWEVVGAGAGGNGGSNFVSINNTVFVNEPVNEVELGLGVAITSKDKLIVHHNSIHLMQNVDYKIEGNKIVKLTEGNWNEDSEEAMFAFELFKNVESVDGNLVELKTKLVCMQNTVTVNGAVNEVKIGIEGFNKDKDTLMVFENETFLTRGVNYEINGNGDGIVPVGDEVWNDVMIDDWSYTFVVFKDVPLVEGEDKIGMDLLADDVKKAIQDASNIDLSGYAEKGEIPVNVSELVNDAGYLTEHQDLSGYATKEEVGGKVAQDAYDAKIAELEGRVNEAFTNANNGKELIANAIGEPVSSDDTFSAMSNDINGLLATFKTNMMNNGITVEANDKFKSLIDKIATMVEEGSGKGIQIAEGACNDITLSTTASRQNFSLGMNIDFTPNIVVVNIKNFRIQYTTYLCNCTVNSLFHNSASNLCYLFGGPNNTAPTGTHMAGDVYITSSNQLSVKNFYYGSETPTLMGISWYAIGVGEEDTTLLDSLKSILAEEGVATTEEDTMASLITKVDTEFNEKNNEINNRVVPAGTATAGNVLSGQTFINSTGQLVTGTMANRGGAQTVTPGTSNKTLNAGYYSGNITVAGDADLVAANIVSGKNIFGVDGTSEISDNAKQQLVDILTGMNIDVSINNSLEELLETISKLNKPSDNQFKASYNNIFRGDFASYSASNNINYAILANKKLFVSYGGDSSYSVYHNDILGDGSTRTRIVSSTKPVKLVRCGDYVYCVGSKFEAINTDTLECITKTTFTGMSDIKCLVGYDDCFYYLNSSGDLYRYDCATDSHVSQGLKISLGLLGLVGNSVIRDGSNIIFVSPGSLGSSDTVIKFNTIDGTSTTLSGEGISGLCDDNRNGIVRNNKIITISHNSITEYPFDGNTIGVGETTNVRHLQDTIDSSKSFTTIIDSDYNITCTYEVHMTHFEVFTVTLL